MKNKSVDLIPLNGDSLCFPLGDFDEEVIEKNCDSINKSTFQSKLQDLHVAQNCRIVIENGKEHLKQIIKTSKFKKIFKEAINSAKEELNLGQQMQPKPKLDNELSNNVKPKIDTPSLKRF